MFDNLKMQGDKEKDKNSKPNQLKTFMKSDLFKSLNHTYGKEDEEDIKF